MESVAAEGPSEIQMHAVAEPVSRVAFPRKPLDASQSMGMDVNESKRERQEQVQHPQLHRRFKIGLQALHCSVLYAFSGHQSTPQR